MIIHAYHESVPGMERAEMLGLWAQSWRAHGWIPVVHGLEEARAHPRFAVYDRVIRELPTVNSPAYEAACWRRWLVAAQTGGFWCDTDLINTGINPAPELGWFNAAFHAIHDGEFPNMGLLCGRGDAFELRFVNQVLRGSVPLTEHNGRPHTSDMFVWRKLHQAGEVGASRDVMATWGQPGAQHAQLIHCSYDATTGRGQDRLAVIRGLVEPNSPSSATRRPNA